MAAEQDPAGRRHPARPTREDGLSPSEAGARRGPASSAGRLRPSAGEIAAPDADRARALAERSIADAEALMRSVLVPVPRRPAHPRPAPPVARRGPQRIKRIPTHARALSWSRRQAGGVALTVAFIPVGWLTSAAVLPGPDAVRAPDGNARAPVTADRFVPELAAARQRGKGTSLAARVPGRSIVLHRTPAGDRIGRLRGRRIEGQRIPLVLLVDRRRGPWLRVHLPVRPNGSKAWIRARHVRLRVNPYRVQISLRRHRMTLWHHGRRTMTRRVGVGQSLAPTPTGRYFVTDLIKARDPNGVYGPYSFGLSGFSPVLTSFRGGGGQIGLHGTNAPEALGTDVSHGCIRLSNRAITALARKLPLGTPVDIRR